MREPEAETQDRTPHESAVNQEYKFIWKSTPIKAASDKHVQTEQTPNTCDSLHSNYYYYYYYYYVIRFFSDLYVISLHSICWEISTSDILHHFPFHTYILSFLLLDLRDEIASTQHIFMRSRLY